MIRFEPGKSPEEDPPPGNVTKILNTLSLGNQTQVLPQGSLNAPEKVDTVFPINYKSWFSTSAEPDGSSVDYMDWENFSGGLDIYRLGDRKTGNSLIKSFESARNIELTMDIGTPNKGGDGQTNLLCVNEMRHDLSGLSLAQAANIIFSDPIFHWEIEVMINRNQPNSYTVAHTLNHEMSLHAAALLDLAARATALMPEPTAPPKEMRQAREQVGVLLGEQIDPGPCSPKATHTSFVTNQNPRVIATHKAMLAALAKNTDGVTSLEADYRLDQKNLAIELKLPTPTYPL
jgi:hypothetical protein